MATATVSNEQELYSAYQAGAREFMISNAPEDVFVGFFDEHVHITVENSTVMFQNFDRGRELTVVLGKDAKADSLVNAEIYCTEDSVLVGAYNSSVVVNDSATVLRAHGCEVTFQDCSNGGDDICGGSVYVTDNARVAEIYSAAVAVDSCGKVGTLNGCNAVVLENGACVGEVYECDNVHVTGNSEVENISGSSVVNVIDDDAIVVAIGDNSTVRDLCGRAYVGTLNGFATIELAQHSSTVGAALDRSRVLAIKGYAEVQNKGDYAFVVERAEYKHDAKGRFVRRKDGGYTAYMRVPADRKVRIGETIEGKAAKACRHSLRGSCDCPVLPTLYAWASESDAKEDAFDADLDLDDFQVVKVRVLPRSFYFWNDRACIKGAKARVVGLV